MDWENYNKKFYIEPDDIIEQENKCFRNIIANIDIRKKKCLDIGCGSGYWIPSLSNRDACIIGTDISLEGLKQCYDLYRSVSSFVIAQGEKLPFPDFSFEIVMVNWILQELYEHIVFTGVINEICRILKTNGKLIVAENIYPDQRILRESTNMGDIFENQNNPPFLRFFPNNTLSAVIDKIGFNQIIYKQAGYSFFEVYEYKP